MGNTGLKKQQLTTAEKTGVLNVSNYKLTEWPENLNNLKGVLRNLNISNNKVRTIPPVIGEFLQLKSLSVDSNSLTELPNEISNLSKLENLSFSENQLRSIPLSYSKLAYLKHVNLSGNQLSDFPSVFCNLKHLDFLDLSKNRIQEVPDLISKLYSIELNLNQNQISILSKQIAECPRLKTLRLQENCLQLSSFPKEVLTQSKVSMLFVDGNLFEMKTFMDLEGYDLYMQRYTEVKKKMY